MMAALDTLLFDPYAQARDQVCRRWCGELVTGSGFTFRVRPVMLQDHDELAAFFARLSLADLRFRFLSSLSRVDEERLMQMIEVDHGSTENFLAHEVGGSDIIATAMIAADETGKRAEVAIATRPDYKRRGIAKTLLEHVSHYARFEGIEILEAVACRENCAVMELEKKLGFTARPLPGESTLMLLQQRLH